MCKFLEKLLYEIVVPGAAVVMIFLFVSFPVSAEEITGSEVSFVHTHGEACYEEVLLSCENAHVRRHSTDQGIYRCDTCDAGTLQNINIYTWSCPVAGVSWQKDCTISCTICGTYHSKWSVDMPGEHHYTEKRLICTLLEGERTATLKIIADNSWTNAGVTLYGKIEVLKQDLSSCNVALDWENGTFFATENGSYTVTATNGQGDVISSTIQVSCIDKITPVIKSTTGNEATMTDTEIEVHVSASDGESGLADMPYSMDGGVTWGNMSTFKVEVGKPISFVIRDKAGNIVACTIDRSQFPYPPKAQTPTIPVPENPGSVEVPQTTPEPSAGKETEESVGKETEKSAGKEVAEAKVKEKAVNDKIIEKNKTNVEEQVLPISVKRTLTREEKEQAYGISIIMQKRARDAFFIKSRETKAHVPKGQADELEKNLPVETVLREDTEVPLTSPINSQESVKYSGQNVGTSIGILLCVLAVGGLVYLLWLHTAVLYCYDGGEEYRKIGLFQVKRGKKELELYLPDYILQSTKAFRYRLMLRNRLVKRCQNRELVVYNEDNKLRQQVEECVDFVL